MTHEDRRGRRAGAAVERLTDAAGLVSLVLGTALTVAPVRSAALLGLGGTPTTGRFIGLLDVVLAPGLLRGRPRWPWMVGRTAVNLLVARTYAVERHRSGGDLRARGGVVAMSVLTLVDGGVAVALRRRSQVSG